MRAHAQGTIALDNIASFNSSPTATSGGLLFVQTAPGNFAPYNGAPVSMELFGGPNADSLAPMVTLTGSNAALFGARGIFFDPKGITYVVAGVSVGNTAFLQLEVWTGNFASLAAAQAAQAANGTSTVFQNPTGGEGRPPTLPEDLIGTPAILIVPEPSTLAFCGVGTMTLLLRRSR